MLEKLKELVCQANVELAQNGLVVSTWGDASGIDRERRMIVIKSIEVEHNKLTPEDMVVVNFDNDIIEGKYKPSSDIETHIELYKSFPDIGGIVHTHSYWATSLCQDQKSLIPHDTNCFLGEIPCTRKMEKEEIINEYEKNTGKIIVETFKDLDENAIPRSSVFISWMFYYLTDLLLGEKTLKMLYITLLYWKN